MLVEVGPEFRVGQLEALRLLEQPGAIDDAVGRQLQGVGHDEHGLGGAAHPVADLAGERGHDPEPERHVGDRGGSKARIEPVGHLDRHGRHQQHQVDHGRLEEPVEPGAPVEDLARPAQVQATERQAHEAQQHQVDHGRLEEPVEPGAPVEVEGDDQQRVGEPHHHHHLEHGAVAPASRPGRDRIEGVDEILAAADREDLEHGAPPLFRGSATGAPGPRGRDRSAARR